jgi:hypothetical protein
VLARGRYAALHSSIDLLRVVLLAVAKRPNDPLLNASLSQDCHHPVALCGRAVLTDEGSPKRPAPFSTQLRQDSATMLARALGKASRTREIPTSSE